MRASAPIALLVFLFLVISRVGVLAGPSPAPTSPAAPGISKLNVGRRVAAQISGGQAHAYRVSLTAGQYARVVVYQRGIDIVLEVSGPGGGPKLSMDCLISAWGPEEVAIVADTTGNYSVEVRPLANGLAAGRYDITLVEVRKATARDAGQIEAQQLYAEGERLLAQQTAESVRRAIDKDKQAAELWRAAGSDHGQGIALFAVSNACIRIGELHQALDYHERALTVFQARRDPGELAAILNSFGTVYALLGEGPSALEKFTQALEIRLSTGDLGGQGNTLNNIGVTYDLLGDHERAVDFLRRSLVLRHAAGDPVGEAGSLSNLGQALHALGEEKAALESLGQALSLARSAGDRRREAMTLDRMGRVFDGLGEKEKALDYLNQALSMSRTLGDRLTEAETLLRIGSVYASFGEKQKALDHYALSVTISRELGNRPAEGQALYNIASAERDRGDLLKARKDLETAMAIFDSLRARVGTQELRASYLASIHGSYELSVDLLMQLHRREPAQGLEAEALKVSESARSRGLLELLMETRAGVREGVDPALLEQEHATQRLLDDKGSGQVRLLNGKHSEKEAEEAAREIATLTSRLQQLRGQIRTSSPHYAALTQPQALTVGEIRKEVLDRDSLLLEYSLGQDRSYLWVVGFEGMRTFELPKRVEIETSARRVYDLLSARNRVVKFESEEDRKVRIQRADAEYPKAAALLSQMLLGQAASQLGGKRLLIVGDGALQYLPFAALPSPTHSEEFVPLAVEHEVVTLPSASVLAVLRRELAGRPPAAKAVAVLADPVFDGSDERVAAGIGSRKLARTARNPAEKSADSELVRSAQDLGLAEGGQLRIPRLPFTRKEAMSILSLAASDSRREALDFDANRSAATSADLGQYRIVHFATHGFLNSLHPELSGLVLSLVDRQGKEQDGFLPALEVFNLSLPADLVVLSGCRTGLGKEIKGEGLVGLTRAFMYAGAARVVVSLWDVNDEATAELMSRFYRGMLGEKPLSPAAALRAAQISIWKEKRWESPYYWAAFVLQGEPR